MGAAADLNLDIPLDDQLGKLKQFLQEGEEGEDEQAQSERADRFAKDVAIEEAEHRHSGPKGIWPEPQLCHGPRPVAGLAELT